MTVKQRKPLNGYHQRQSKSVQRTHVTPNARIPTSDELPEASADLAEMLDTWHQLIASEKEQARLAAVANGKADAAAATYREQVRAALSSGEDPTKVKNDTDRHKATAAAHIKFHDDARNQREKLGHTLGPVLEAEAAAMFAPIEERIEKSARTVRGALAGVREAWAVHSADFEMRRWLSHAELRGGQIGAYHGASPLPHDVAAALATLEDHINALDKLKADEQEVREYRAANGGEG
jgi:hypothetical protein